MLKMLLVSGAVGLAGAGIAAAVGHGAGRAACVAPRMSVRIGPRAVEIVGLDAELLARLRRASAPPLAVHVRTAGASVPPVAGTYHVTDSVFEFRPAFPFVAGVTYDVRFDPSVASRNGCPTRAIDTVFAIPKAPTAGGTVVTAIYPSVDVLPMNQLKLYVHFSAAMRSGEASAHVRLVDVLDGTVVRDAFFRPEDELWDASQTRLTLLFDPARVKRGLTTNEQMGLPLRAGRRYRLVIDAGWPDANGDSLGRGIEKRFAVSEPDRRAPRASTWTVSAPRAGSRDTLTVSFGEPMDQALLERLVSVPGVDGTSTVGRREAEWRFVPSAPWTAGRHTIRVGTALEDLAGNNLRRLFDRDLREPLTDPLEVGETVSLRVILSEVKFLKGVRLLFETSLRSG